VKYDIVRQQIIEPGGIAAFDGFVPSSEGKIVDDACLPVRAFARRPSRPAAALAVARNCPGIMHHLLPGAVRWRVASVASRCGPRTVI